MPEPGITDRNFTRPTTGTPRRPGERRQRNLLKIPREYADFQLEDGRQAIDVLGEEFFEQEISHQGVQPDMAWTPAYSPVAPAGDNDSQTVNLPLGPEDDTTEPEELGFLERGRRKFHQAFHGLDIFAQLDEIRKQEERRQGKRTELMETPRRQKQIEAAPPTGEPDISELEEAEWRALQESRRQDLADAVESLSRNYRELRKEPGSVDFWKDPNRATSQRLDRNVEQSIDGTPLASEPYWLLVRTLVEHGADPGDPEAVMAALYDKGFQALLDERRNEWIWNSLINEGLDGAGAAYDGGAQKPLETGEERVRPLGAKAQLRRVLDRAADAGYGTEISNIMMDFSRLHSTEQGFRPDQTMPPRLGEQHRDRLPRDDTAFDRYARLPPYPRVATKKALIERLAGALERHGGVRERLKASEARPGSADDTIAAMSRLAVDTVGGGFKCDSWSCPGHRGQ